MDEEAKTNTEQPIKVADETPEMIAKLFGVDMETAEFMLSFERGELPTPNSQV